MNLSSELNSILKQRRLSSILDSLEQRNCEALPATYEKMLKIGNLRFCVKPNRMPSNR